MRVETATDEAGRRVFEKRAETSDEAGRLRREADLLEVATHPGLVELTDFEDGAEPRLRTGFLDGGALSQVGGLEIEEVAGVVAALASTIADLHAMGLVHGAVAPEHVVLDEDGRPVLCSLGYGGLAGERPSALPALPPSLVDPSRSEEAPLDPAFDVFGAGAILRELAARVAGHPRRVTVDTLDRIADRATGMPPADRPTSRSFADAVHDAVIAARLPGRGGPTTAPHPAQAVVGRDDQRGRERPLERWRQAHASAGRSRTRLTLVLPVAAVSVIAAGVLIAQGRPEDAVAPESLGSPIVTETSAPARAAPTTSLPALADATAPARPSVAGTTGCARLDAVLSADVDGDGCAESVRFSEGVLEAGPFRWSVGQPGDVAAVGDWSCEGRSSLAVLRPATGDIFAFDGWATADGPVHAPVVHRVGGAQTLRAADLDGDGCHELLVERATGAPVVVRIPSDPPS